MTTAAQRLTRLPNFVLWLLAFAAVSLAHLTLLHLPYYWDEGGYYVPAALDFYRRWTLIPQFTNAHPPLPNVVLGLLWHVFGFHILVTRLTAAAFAAAALVAVFRLAGRFASPAAAATVTLLTATYPIWFAQSTLAHADIVAAAFTLSGFVLYFDQQQTTRRLFLIATVFSLAALSKETAICEPAALAALELYLLWKDPAKRTEHFRWLVSLSFPVLPLICWYVYHHHKTGFTFGNPEYLRYNATANFTVAHLWLALRYRAIHLFLQRDIWLPILFGAACLFLPRRADITRSLTRAALRTIAVLVVANWIFFSVLGGALLTRYLLPVYPLLLLVCVDTWCTRTARWPLLGALTTAAFISAWWINPPVSFAPEDNLTYRDMIVVHQRAVEYVAQHYPHATVLTAWPVSADLSRPDLGYTSFPIRVTQIDDFSFDEVWKAAEHPGDFDTAIVITTHYMSPSLKRYLANHPNSPRGTEFARNRDLSPQDVARLLHGTVMAQWDQNGELAAVLRFPRSYDAALR